MPRDNETDMNAPESVGAIKIYDLVWSASEFVAVGFGNKKIRINFVNENKKILLGVLEEEMQVFGDYVKSTRRCCYSEAMSFWSDFELRPTYSCTIMRVESGSCIEAQGAWLGKLQARPGVITDSRD